MAYFPNSSVFLKNNVWYVNYMVALIFQKYFDSGRNTCFLTTPWQGYYTVFLILDTAWFLL